MSYRKQNKVMTNQQDINESRSNNEPMNLNGNDGYNEVPFNDAIKAFEYFDMNHNGKVNLSELKEKLTTFGDAMSEEEFNNIFNRIGIEQNNHENINYMEFINFLVDNK